LLSTAAQDVKLHAAQPTAIYYRPTTSTSSVFYRVSIVVDANRVVYFPVTCRLTTPTASLFAYTLTHMVEGTT